MKIPILTILLGLLLACGARAGVAPLYINDGQANSPQVDATIFVNNGVFNASSTLPFTTEDTLYFTNTGSMVGSDGFRFDYETATNSSTNLASIAALAFYNDGSIEASSSGFLNFGGVALSSAGFLNLPALSGNGSYIFIDAGTVNNSGYFGVDSTGIMSITGTNVSMAFSGLRAGTLPGESETGGGNFIFVGGATSFGDVVDQLYVNDAEIFDSFGGLGTNGNFAGTGPLLNPVGLNPPNTGTPGFQVFEGGRIAELGGLPDMGNFPEEWAALAYTNQINGSNLLVQVFFVNTNNADGDPSFSVQVAFANNPNTSTQLGKIAIARFNLTNLDPITGTAFTNSAFVMDDIATITNAIIMTNAADGIGIRPSNLAVTFGIPREWQGTRDQGNIPYDVSLIASTNYLISVVTNLYSVYGATIAQSPSASPTYANTDPTNYPGRIEINAQNLDVTEMRVQSLGPASITAQTLTNNSGAVALGLPKAVDTEFVNLTLGSPKKSLVVSGYVPKVVYRLNGNVAAWSGNWTNYLNQVVGAGTTNVTTNVITVVTFATVIDQSFHTAIQGSVLKLALHAGDADIQDAPVYVEESLSLAVTNLTVSGNLYVVTTTNLDSGVSPNLASLTVPGSGSVVLYDGDVALGVNYAHLASSNILTGFTNQGLIEANSVTVNAQTAINSGQITTENGPITIQAAIGKLDFGTLGAQGNVNLFGADIKGQGVTIQAGGPFSTSTGNNVVFPGALNIAVTNDFEDGGASAGNVWTTYGGFNLLVKPVIGDLLGTSLTTYAAGYGQEVLHTWAGQDLGPNPGVSNDVVLGALYLNSADSTFGEFVFSPVGASNALYTTFLGFEGNVDLTWLQINPGLVIYFGGFSGAGLAIADLTNAFPGQLVYVPGLGSSASPLSLRSLASAGSLQQGQALIRSTGGANLTSVLSWTALGQTSYQVQFATNLFGPWQTVYTGANNANITLPMQASFTPSTNNPVGFYRVRQANP